MTEATHYFYQLQKITEKNKRVILFRKINPRRLILANKFFLVISFRNFLRRHIFANIVNIREIRQKIICAKISQQGNNSNEIIAPSQINAHGYLLNQTEGHRIKFDTQNKHRSG